ncbi:hypothetical protein K0M31_006353 [Melipona bicolor]|uniref:Uncharacterized protein n=1 Tax=Melipona bicolor TaxID=60889 RepID=A0AA40FU36_9HYME|nr:hypothetical protein K0M31_006353 [Melipona bicolor]
MHFARSPTRSPRSFPDNNRKSILLADVSHVSKLRTTYLRSVRHSPLSFARNSLATRLKRMPKVCLFFSLSLSLLSSLFARPSTLEGARARRPFRADFADSIDRFELVVPLSARDKTEMELCDASVYTVLLRP